MAPAHKLRPPLALIALAAAWTPAVARAQTAAPLPADTAAAATAPRVASTKRSPTHAFRGSVLFWDHAVTTRTLGFGGHDYQSENPTYEMTFQLAPRFTFLETSATRLGVRADARVVREFTDSDRTTERGEWMLTDTELWLEGNQRLAGATGRKTELVLRAPVLLLPTSQFSAAAGRVLGLGAGLGLDQDVPLRAEPVLVPRLALRPRLSYSYQFSEAVVAVNDDIDRVRIDPDGRAFVSDQLNGSALPQHLLSLSTRIEAHFSEKLLLSVDIGLRYMRRYDLEQSVSLCGNVATGCAEVRARGEAAAWAVSTVFVASVGYAVTEYAELSLGYTNHAEQLGENGQYRGFFDSPGSRVFFTIGISLDALYDHVAGNATSHDSPGEEQKRDVTSARAEGRSWDRFQ